MSILAKLRGLFTSADSDELWEAREPILHHDSFRQAGQISSDDGKPRFRTTATDRAHAGSNESVRRKVREAFVPSQPVQSSGMFAGRRTLLATVINAIEDHGAHVVLYGDRGIGKTSLLRVITEIARDADYLVVHENCGSASRFEEVFRAICQQIPLLYYGALPPVETQAREGASLADVLAEGDLGASHIARVLSEVTGTRVIIVLDEFDRVEGSAFQHEVAELIKNLSDASARVQLVIAGVADNLHDLLGHSPSIRRNVIGISVERMSGSEIEQIIEIGERHTQLKFDPQARAVIVGCAQGSPYLARLLSHHASLASLEAGRTTVQEADAITSVDQSLSEIEARLPRHIRVSVGSWIAEEPRTMFELARAALDGSGSFDLSEVGARSGLSPVEKLALAQRLAQSSGIVTPAESPGRFKFSEEGLSTYLLLATSPPALSRRPSPIG